MFERFDPRDLPRRAKIIGATVLTVFAVDTGVRLHHDLDSYPSEPIPESTSSVEGIVNLFDPASWLAQGVTVAIRDDLEPQLNRL
jgi:hypothetical protein